MASLNPFITIIFIITSTFSFTSSHKTPFKLSTIASEPTVLPDSLPPSQSPALSPDITPLFPTPSTTTNPPADSSLPIIPSSPSPPNPDSLSTPHPEFTISPTAAPPESSALAFKLSFLLNLALLFLGFFI
ncbi:classical arabinogalactan protein 26-like [Amaranthus tricolor]|uniref:classical arabinogalactan protein 26-like n=1 Tax=Amaranthus tricolor TaxID=29722 RepID=UPI00258E431C|nr:classical arabinogalactan protein 26-like [Amaranthus tricolor]